MRGKKYRVAVDTGGTFTDINVLDEATGESWAAKAPTTPHNTTLGVLDAIQSVRLDLASVDKFFVHGATTAINALLERKGAIVAYIGTDGFRDVPEIGRYNRARIYDIKYKRPEAIVPRDLRFEVRERMGHTGEVIVPLDEATVTAVAEQLNRRGITSVAVCLHHAYRNPAHEERVRQLLMELCPRLEISISSEVACEHREYERAMTTIIDAYIKPLVARWVDELDDELRERGLKAELLLTRSDGGGMRAESGKKSPIQTLLSGPSGGVMGGMFMSRLLDEPNLINMDMGGTSLDFSMIKAGEAELKTETRAEGYELLLPNLDIRAVAAGGGSIGWLDAAGGIHVGPRSAGAFPGPICYGKGGAEPTVTDALVASGFIDPNYFLGGTMLLSRELAEEGIRDSIAGPLGMATVKAAGGMLRISLNQMVQAIRSITVQRGEDPRDYSLLCYGGGGPLFGAMVAQELGMRSAIVPVAASTFSAWGMLTVDVRHALVETDVRLVDDLPANYVAGRLDELLRRGNEALDAERIGDSDRSLLPSIDMRYAGQEHSVNVPIDFDVSGDCRERLTLAFSARYESVYGYSLPFPAEMVALRVAAVGSIPNPVPRRLGLGSGNPADAFKGTRELFDFVAERTVSHAVYERAHLLSDDHFAGPALVEEATTVTTVPIDSSCAVDQFGNLVITFRGVGSWS